MLSNPEYSLEGLLLKLKLQYFGHLMQGAGSLEKTLMLGKTEGKRRRGRQRVRWLDSIADSVDMNLSKLRETVKDRGAWRAAVHGLPQSRTRLSDWTKTTCIHQSDMETHCLSSALILALILSASCYISLGVFSFVNWKLGIWNSWAEAPVMTQTLHTFSGGKGNNSPRPPGWLDGPSRSQAPWETAAWQLAEFHHCSQTMGRGREIGMLVTNACKANDGPDRGW